MDVGAPPLEASARRIRRSSRARHGQQQPAHSGHGSVPPPPTVQPLSVFDIQVRQEQQAATQRLQLQPIDPAAEGLQMLRVRPDGELEPATWPGASAGENLVRLRSVHSWFPQLVRFKNATQRTVHLLWLDHNGNENILDARACVLPPAAADSEWQTFCTHPWLARDATSGLRLKLGDGQVLVVAPGDGGKTFLITESPLMEWTHKSHRHYSGVHRAAVLTALLCHRRLERDTPAAPLLEAAAAAAPPGPPLKRAHGGGASGSSTPAATPLATTARLSPSCRPHKRARVEVEVEQEAAVDSMSTPRSGGGGGAGRWATRGEDDAAAATAAADAARWDAAELEARVRGFARLPNELVQCIVDRMAPDSGPPQDVAAHPHGHADVPPARLEEDPADWLPPPPPPPLLPQLPLLPPPPAQQLLLALPHLGAMAAAVAGGAAAAAAAFAALAAVAPAAAALVVAAAPPAGPAAPDVIYISDDEEEEEEEGGGGAGGGGDDEMDSGDEGDRDSSDEDYDYEAEGGSGKEDSD